MCSEEEGLRAGRARLVGEGGVILLRAPAPLGLRSVRHACRVVRLPTPWTLPQDCCRNFTLSIHGDMDRHRHGGKMVIGDAV